jgi:hypothetical protein
MAEIETAVAQVLFEVEEEKGRWLVRIQQQYVPGTAALRYGAVRLDLNDGVTRQEAEELARLLNERVHSMIFSGESPAAERGA